MLSAVASICPTDIRFKAPPHSFSYNRAKIRRKDIAAKLADQLIHKLSNFLIPSLLMKAQISHTKHKVWCFSAVMRISI